MDLVPAFIFNAGWVFFAAWTMALAALSVIAFGRDILAYAAPASSERKRRP
jgi:hypothetical protein